MKKIVVGFAGALLALGAIAGPKTPVKAEPIPYFAANCANCHGTDGKNQGAIPGIAGRDRTALLNTLKAYKEDNKSATIMHQLAKGYTDEELEILADFFSKQK